MTLRKRLILALLEERGELTPMGVVNASEGLLLRVSIYYQLSELEKDGFVTSHLEKAPPGRFAGANRVYKVTGAGRSAMRNSDAWAKTWGKR